MTSDARIRFACPTCGTKLSVVPAAAGRTLPCPNPECGQPVIVPSPVRNGSARPAMPASGANLPAGPALATASKLRAIMIAAALSTVSLGVGLSYSRFREANNQKSPETQTAPKSAPAEAPAGNDSRAAAGAAPQPKPEVTKKRQRNVAQTKPGVAKKRQGKVAQKKQVRRKRDNKTLSEYAALASSHSLEYYHNERQVTPANPDADMPRIRQLAQSDNADIREVASSIMKAHDLIEEQRRNPANAQSPMDIYRNGLLSLAQNHPGNGPVYRMGGRTVISDSQDFSNRINQAASLASDIRRAQAAQQSFMAELRKLDEDRRRTIYRLAKQLAGPRAGKAAGMRLNAETFVAGEAVFRSDDSPKATYCLTLSNEGASLTHCSIAVVMRRTADSRSADGPPPDFGPPFGLDELAEAVLQPDQSRAVPDIVGLYYVGKINAHDKVHFLPLQGKLVAENVERVGIVLFSDQTTIMCDPAACLQEVTAEYLTRSAASVEGRVPPQSKPRSTQAPRRPAQPSKRAKGALRRK